MSVFIVERRLLGASLADLVLLQEALRFACDRLTSRGEPVRCLCSTFLPGPARLLSVFEAPHPDAVHAVNEIVHAPIVSLEAAIKIDPAPPPGQV